jgi:hypothetical protein
MKALSVFEALGGRKAVRAAVAMAALAVIALPIQSQDANFQPPRLANGKPDLNGI